MRIVSLQASNIHHLPVMLERDLGPVVLFLGPNTSGKSTRLGVPALALLGPSGKVWPLFGERPTYDFAASVTLSDGTTIRRAQVGGEHQVEINHRKIGIREAEAMIGGKVGRPWAYHAIEGVTPTALQTWLLAEVPFDASWTVAKAGEALARAGGSAGVAAEVRDPAAGLAWLASTLDAVDAALRESAADVRRLTGAVASTAADEAPPVGGTVASWRLAAETARGQVAELREELGRAREAGDAATRAAEATRRREEKIARTRASLSDARGKIDAAMADGKAAAAAAVQHRQDAARLEAAAAAAEARLAAARAAAADTTRAADTYAMACRLGDGVPSGDGPWLGQYDSGHIVTWEAGNPPPILPSRIYPIASLSIVAQALASDGLEGLRRVAEAAQAQRASEVEEALAAARTMLGAAERGAAAARQAVAEATAAAVRAERLAETHRATLRELRGAVIRFEDQITAAEAENTAAVETEANVPPTEPIVARIEGLTSEIKTAEHNADRLSDHVGRTAAAADNAARLVAARERSAALTVARRIVRETIGACLSATCAPLEEVASRITRPVFGMGIALDFAEDGARFMFTRPDRAPKPATGSGGETLVATTAIRAAIAARRQGLSLLLVDRLEELDANRRGPFLAALRALVDDGKIGQVLVAGVDDGWRPADEIGADVRLLQVT